MTVPLGDRKGRKGQPQASPRGQGTEEGGPPSTQGPGSCRSWRVLGAASTHFPTAQVCPAWVLGQESWGQCQDEAPGWHNAGQGWLIQPPQDCASDGGSKGMGADTTGTCRGLCSTSGQRSTRLHWGSQLPRGPPPWLTSPDCKIQQSLAY